METIQAMILRHEGNKKFPYMDTVGKLTIGIGRNLSDNGISKEESLFLLNNDIVSAQEELNWKFPWFLELNAVRQNALTDMLFNLGLPRLLRFKKFIAAMAAKDYNIASNEMLDSIWARQVGYRAIELAKMIRTGKPFNMEN